MRSQDDRGERCPGPRQAVRPYQLLRDILVTVASSLALFLTKQINLLLRLRYSLPSRLILVLLSRLRYFLSSRFILIYSTGTCYRYFMLHRFAHVPLFVKPATKLLRMHALFTMHMFPGLYVTLVPVLHFTLFFTRRICPVHGILLVPFSLWHGNFILTEISDNFCVAFTPSPPFGIVCVVCV